MAADNIPITVGSGTNVAADDIGSVFYQRIKVSWGPDGTANETDTATGTPFPVQLRGSDGTDRSNALPITIASAGIASGALASGAVSSGAVALGAFATGAVGSGAIASGAVASGAIASGAFASGSVGSGAFASGSIGSGAIASGAIASGAVASGAVASGAFASGSVADGAMVTLGAKADAKSTATDTTAITLMQVAKQISASAQLISTALGATALDLGSGTGGTRTLRAMIDTAQVSPAADQYETVAASQTAQALGGAGATGDHVAGVVIVPASTSPGNVILLDNAISITVFAGGASSVSNLCPFFIPLGIKSVSGAWKITTGASVSCIGIGTFT